MTPGRHGTPPLPPSANGRLRTSSGSVAARASPSAWPGVSGLRRSRAWGVWRKRWSWRQAWQRTRPRSQPSWPRVPAAAG